MSNGLPGLEGTFSTLLVDPPWRFQNRTGKMAPEHKRLRRYRTMTTAEIAGKPVQPYTDDRSHLYLWVPNALLRDGLDVMDAWGFTYKTNLVWSYSPANASQAGRNGAMKSTRISRTAHIIRRIRLNFVAQATRLC